MGVWNHIFLSDTLGQPLPGSRRALGQFPIIFEECCEVAVVPLSRIWGPGAFDTTGDGVTRLTAAVLAGPTKALLSD